MPTVTIAKNIPFQPTNRVIDYDYMRRLLLPQARSQPEVFGRFPRFIEAQTSWNVVPDADALFACLQVLKVSPANSDAIRNCLLQHTDLSMIVADTIRQVRQTYPTVPLSLELVSDPEAGGTETLVLYLQDSQVDPSLFNRLRIWNHRIAERMVSSAAWFLVNLDLRSQT